MIGTRKIEFLGPILRAPSTFCPFRLIPQAVLIYGPQTGPFTCNWKRFDHASSNDEKWTAQAGCGQKQRFRSLSNSLFGLYSTNYLAIPVSVFRSYRRKRHASATVRNFVLYRWHLALRSIAIIKRHALPSVLNFGLRRQYWTLLFIASIKLCALPSALNVTRYHRHQAPIREVRVKTAKGLKKTNELSRKMHFVLFVLFKE